MHIRGVVLPGGEVRDAFVSNGRITFRERADAETLLEDCFLVPGLVDAHAHLALASPAPDGATPEERIRASAEAQLRAGVLAVREPGSPTRLSRGLGPAEGLPRVVTAGRFLAPPGRYFPGLAREMSSDDLPAAAEEEARASGAWAKIVGDFPSPDGRLTLNFPLETLAEAVRRVHEAGGRAAIHAVAEETVEAAIEAGFDSIEHASFMGPDHIRPMAERGITLVPTLMIAEGIVSWLASIGIPAEHVEAARRALGRHPDLVRQAAEAGVRVLAGTDAGMVPHGSIREEVRRLLEAGLPPVQALGAASWIARSWLGLPGIEEGAPADLVAFRDDPREHPDVLGEPALVVLDGRVVHPRP